MWIAVLCICILAWNFAIGLLARYLHARKRRRRCTLPVASTSAADESRR